MTVDMEEVVQMTVVAPLVVEHMTVVVPSWVVESSLVVAFPWVVEHMTVVQAVVVKTFGYSCANRVFGIGQVQAFDDFEDSVEVPQCHHHCFGKCNTNIPVTQQK